jgi:hypothetical protein
VTTAEEARDRRLEDPGLQARRHLRFGWWALLAYLSLGIALEAMHGFKLGWYLDVTNETRRQMFTLAHAHGVLLSLLNVAFGLCATRTRWAGPRPQQLASASLRTATLLLPGGFLLGGLVVYGGDPGLGILLVPVGALLLFVSVFLTARALGGGASR